MKNDSGPAFPSHGSMGEVTHEGMSLRDYFAGQALAGMLPARDDRGRSAYTHMSHEEIARMAFEQADEMLAAREQS